MVSRTMFQLFQTSGDIGYSNRTVRTVPELQDPNVAGFVNDLHIFNNNCTFGLIFLLNVVLYLTIEKFGEEISIGMSRTDCTICNLYFNVRIGQILGEVFLPFRISGRGCTAA